MSAQGPRRPAGFFRGSELPRLVTLVSFLVLGGTIVAVMLQRQAASEARREAARVEATPLPPRDESFELEGIVDKAALTQRETPGYFLLLERVRGTPAADLARAARRDVVYAQLLEDPRRFRGMPIRVEGTARRVLQQPADGSNVFRQSSFFEAYTFTGDSQGFPYILVFEEAPKGLQVGDNVFQRLTFDGYFFKLLAYQAGDGRRFAPLLIGRLVSFESDSAPAPRGGFLERNWPWVVLGTLMLFSLVRWTLALRGTLRRPTTRPWARGVVQEEIAPEELKSWLEGPKDEESGPEDGPKP
jgi:hypothetical protein